MLKVISIIVLTNGLIIDFDKLIVGLIGNMKSTNCKSFVKVFSVNFCACSWEIFGGVKIWGIAIGDANGKEILVDLMAGLQ